MLKKKEKLEKAETKKQTIGSFLDFRRALHSRGELLSGLRAARPLLVPGAIPGIVKKSAENRIYKNAIVREPLPRNIESLKLKRALPIASDQVEAAWTASVLSLFGEELCLFVKFRDQYYRALTSNDYGAAATALDRIQADLGFSLWLISARIALLQMQGGTTSQKQYLRKLLSAKRISGFVAYLIYLFGFTADDNVSLAEVTREWSRQESFKLSDDTIQYFRYHISSFHFSEIKNPWRCVALEENSSIVDRFETFCEMSSLAFIRSETISDAYYIRDAMMQLDGIPDRRIQNLLALFSGSTSSSGISEVTPAINATYGGDSPSIRESLERAILELPNEFSLHEAAARLGTRSENVIRLRSEFSFANSLISQLENVIALNENYHESRFALQKTALVHRNSPIARAIISFLSKDNDRIIAKTANEDEAAWAIAGFINGR